MHSRLLITVALLAALALLALVGLQRALEEAARARTEGPGQDSAAPAESRGDPRAAEPEAETGPAAQREHSTR